MQASTGTHSIHKLKLQMYQYKLSQPCVLYVTRLQGGFETMQASTGTEIL